MDHMGFGFEKGVYCIVTVLVLRKVYSNNDGDIVVMLSFEPMGFDAGTRHLPMEEFFWLEHVGTFFALPIQLP